MKLFKKLMSYFIALTMVLSLATLLGGNVHAAEATTYTLTLTGTATGHTYEAYQVFTGNLAEKEGKKVLSNVQWGTGVTYTQAQGENKSAADVAKDLGDGTMTIDTLIDRLTLTKDATAITTKESTAPNTEITGLAAGYYLVKDQDDTQANTQDAYTKFIVQVVGPAYVNVKSSVPEVTKKVKDTNDSTGTTSDWQDSADADIGDDVEYRLRGTMPSTIGDYDTYKYVFTDTMSKGLTYSATKKDNTSNTTVNNYTIKVYPNGDDEENKSNVIDITDAKKTDGTYYFVNNGEGISVTTDGEYKDGKEFTWTCSDLKAIPALKNKDGSSILNANSVVTVEYKATLNTNAKVGSAGNPNKVDLTYSNNPNNGGSGETGKTSEDKNIVFTYKTVFNKVNEKGEALSGAGFTLNKWNGNKFVATDKAATVESGTKFTFSGLDDGIYQLVESTTPAGYNTMKPMEFEITATHTNDPDTLELQSLTMKKLDKDKLKGDADQTLDEDVAGTVSDGSMTTNVVNKKGSILPSTGGMGTTLLYVAGGILVACAAAYVVLNKKRA